MKPQPNDRRPSILIVDDDPTSLHLLSYIFSDLYSLTIANNAEDALVLVKEVPDLILLDINLPGINGLDLCRVIKLESELSEIPIIFITGTSDIEIEENGISLGAVDFIYKPYSAPVLKARVRNHIELKRKADQLQVMALKDPLTNVYNRRHFEHTLHAEWQRHARTKTPLSILMVDIDHFKNVNDEFGHQMGDECIIEVCKAISDSVQRPADFVARYGGEEFVVFLPDTNIAGAMAVAEHIRLKVIEMTTQRNKSTTSFPRLTVSVGCACSVPESKVTPYQLVKSADDALYAAKFAGRNKVKSAAQSTAKSEGQTHV